MVIERAQARSQSNSAPSYTLNRSPKLDEQSGVITFFTNNFTCGRSRPGTTLFWMPSNFDDLVKTDCARLSLHSVGAMALARQQRSSDLFRDAQKMYGLALLSLAKVWSHEAEIDKDAIQLAVLFLGFFEILASYEPSSRESWITHIGSLGALFARRQGEFFKSEFGSRMLLQSRTQAIVNALQTRTAVLEVFQHASQKNPQSIPAELLPPHYRPPGDSPKTTDFLNPPLIGTVYWLLWPLEVVGSSRETPSELREWICQCFTRIHDLTGVAKARVVVDRLAGKRGASIVN